MRKFMKYFSLILVVLCMVGCGNNNSTSNPSDSSVQQNLGSIKQFDYVDGVVLMLDTKGDLYAYGSSTFLGTYDDVTKVSSNVKAMNVGANQVFFTDNKNDLYYFGLGINGGVSKEPSFLMHNAKTAAGPGLCVVAQGTDDSLYFKSGFRDYYCGFTETYPEFTKYENIKVKQVIGMIDGMGYIDDNGDLYIGGNGEIKKVSSNIKTALNTSSTTTLALSNDGVLYSYETYSGLTEVDQNVSNLRQDGLYEKEGKIYDSDKNECRSDLKILVNGSCGELSSISYVNNKNKLVVINHSWLTPDVEEKEVDLSIKNMKNIQEVLKPY